jgi:hypothetical protein
MSITNIKGTFIRMSECTGLIMEYSLWSNEYSIMRLVLSFPSFSRGKIMETEKKMEKEGMISLIMEYSLWSTFFQRESPFPEFVPARRILNAMRRCI